MNDPNESSRREALMRKLEALLAKADPENGGTEAEMTAAMAKAQELMTKYGLEECEIRRKSSVSSGPSVKDVVCYEFRTGTIEHSCYRWIFDVIRKMCNVRMVRSRYYDPVRNKRYFLALLIGLPDDIAVARILFLPMKNLMRRMPPKRAKAMGVPLTCGFENSYYAGAAAGILDANEKAKAAVAKTVSDESNREWSLVLVNKDAIVKEYIQTQMRTRPSRATHTSTFDPAYGVGFTDGSEMNIHKAIQRT